MFHVIKATVNFSASQLELGYVSADNDSVAAGLARVKPSAKSFMQEFASSCFDLFVCVCVMYICCYETLNVTRGETIHQVYDALWSSGHDSVHDSFSMSFDTVWFT